MLPVPFLAYGFWTTNYPGQLIFFGPISENSKLTDILGLPWWSSGWQFTFQCRGHGSISGRGSKNPQVEEQLSLCVITESAHSRVCMLQPQEPESCSKTWWSEIKREKKKTTDNFPFLLLLLVVWVLTSSGKLWWDALYFSFKNMHLICWITVIIESGSEQTFQNLRPFHAIKILFLCFTHLLMTLSHWLKNTVLRS